jgi:hypothetical protein
MVPTPALPLPFSLPALLDERSDPDFRTVFGWLSRRSSEMDVALTRLRLSTLDLDAAEVGRLRRLRLLLAQVDAVSLQVEACALLGDETRGATLRHLGHLLAHGVIEIRAAPLAGWSPDFTVFSTESGPQGVLLGPHWFQRPFPHRGPALASLHGPDAASRVRERFTEAWERGHDIGAAVVGILERGLRPADGGPGPYGREASNGGALSAPRSIPARLDTSEGSG